MPPDASLRPHLAADHPAGTARASAGAAAEGALDAIQDVRVARRRQAQLDQVRQADAQWQTRAINLQAESSVDGSSATRYAVTLPKLDHWSRQADLLAVTA